MILMPWTISKADFYTLLHVFRLLVHMEKFGFVGLRSGLWATLGMRSRLENYVILWNAWDQTSFSVTRIQANFDVLIKILQN